jgi:hypothetical protein
VLLSSWNNHSAIIQYTTGLRNLISIATWAEGLVSYIFLRYTRQLSLYDVVGRPYIVQDIYYI